jgi:hypothetical protein
MVKMSESTREQRRLNRLFRRIRLAPLLAFGLAALLAAGVPADEPKPAGLFETNETLEVTIIAPWREFVSDDDYKGAYPAKIEYTDELGNSESLDLTVERRGVTRQRICKIPPVKLRFEKGLAKGTTFRGQKSLKMVTHCESSSGYEQYYILEMLAYRIYNQLTDFSFRVRPLTITYYQAEAGDEKDSGLSFFKKKKTEGPVFAFLIEDDKDVAKRHDLDKLRIPKISPSKLDTDEAALFGLFQYLIGNVDWAATSGPDPQECCHNTKLIGPEPTRPEDVLYAIPYDFDSSGLVNAKYAVPPAGLPIRKVTQRLYRGYCAHNPGLENARRKMIDNKQAIYDLIRNEDRLNSSSRNRAIGYIDGFYETIEDERDFQEKIVKECRG